MLLRSGLHYKLHPPAPKMCSDCTKYWGNPTWKMKCSVCSGHVDKDSVSPYWGFEDPEYQKELEKWVSATTEESNNYMPLLKIAATKINTKILKDILMMMRSKLVFITAEQAYPLLRNSGTDSTEKSHLICQFIIDWWNMKKYPYNGTEMCYFGNFGDDSDSFKFPPPLPNSSGHPGCNIFRNSIDKLRKNLTKQ